jgi:hypothetical protein
MVIRLAQERESRRVMIKEEKEESERERERKREGAVKLTVLFEGNSQLMILQGRKATINVSSDRTSRFRLKFKYFILI